MLIVGNVIIHVSYSFVLCSESRFGLDIWLLRILSCLIERYFCNDSRHMGSLVLQIRILISTFSISILNAFVGRAKPLKLETIMVVMLYQY